MSAAAKKQTPDLPISDRLSLPVAAVTERFGFLGQSGSGKTYAAMRLAELMLDLGAQVVALDPVGPWWGLRAAADGKSEGYPISVFGGIHGDVPLTPGAGALVADVLVDKGISAVLDVSDFTIGEMHHFVTDFAERFFDRKKRTPTPVHLFFEEAHTFMPERLPPDPKAALMLHRVERIARVGRNYGVGSSQISQMPQAVSKRALNQISCLFAMRTLGTRERKAISEWFDDHATSDDQPKLKDVLSKLETGEAYVASPSWLKVFEKAKVSRKVTFDSSATPKFGAHVVAPKTLAPVDAAALRDAMAIVVAEAEKDDPKPLRKRIAELEAQLKKAGAPIAPAPAKVERVDVPVLKEKDLERLQRMVDHMLTGQVELGMAVKEIAGKLEILRRPAPITRTAAPIHSSAPARPAIRSVPREHSGEGSLGTGERAVLTAIAQNPDGVDRDQLSVLTGYKRSTRDAYLQRLGAAGLIAQTGKHIRVTEEGLKALGDSFEPLPTGDALRAHWMQRLPEGERRILEEIVRAYPQSISREQLGETTGYARSSRDAYLQRLSARRLVVTSSGEVCASEDLF